MPIINRCLSKTNLERAKTDLSFLVAHLGRSRFRGELAIEFRGPSELSVYVRGLRLAQVRFCRGGTYRVTTHRRFIKGTTLEDRSRFTRADNSTDTYPAFDATRESLRVLLQTSYLAAMRSRIKGIPSKEEAGVAHFIAADTMQGTDVVVIDREVGDSAPEHRGERLDLLALQRVRSGEYRFLAIEVKLGNNPELDIATQERRGERSAVEQVKGYRDHIEKYFDEYAACYTRNIAQKLELGLLKNGCEEAPTIVRGTRALLVVAGYSGIARPHLDAIAREHADLWVKTFDYGLRSGNGIIEGLRRSL